MSAMVVDGMTMGVHNKRTIFEKGCLKNLLGGKNY
jgi:hypothetical protein